MRNSFAVTTAGLLAVAVFSSLAVAQTAQPQSQTQGNPWKFNPKAIPTDAGGPAPKRDFNGTWAGPGSSPAVPRGAQAEKPMLTPLGQQLMSPNKPIGKFSPAGTNDPHARYCDPVGFPSNIYTEGRGLTIATLPDRVLFLLQYMTIWREAWTDGRPLPTGVGGTQKDALDPTYNGYSVAHWEDDNTLVVETTGMDDKTWLNGQGYPHSLNAKVTERYTRPDHNDLKLTVTFDDPTIYTKAFALGGASYKWNPNQKMDDFSCIPSQVIKYLTEFGDPAGSDPNAPEERIGRQ